MSAAETEHVELEDPQAVRDAADAWAEEYGTAEAIQRLWTALAHLKRRQTREETES